MKKVLLTTAILAIFTNYIDNASATTMADRLAAARAFALKQAQQQKQPTTTAKPTAPTSTLSAPQKPVQTSLPHASTPAKQPVPTSKPAAQTTSRPDPMIQLKADLDAAKKSEIELQTQLAELQAKLNQATAGKTQLEDQVRQLTQDKADAATEKTQLEAQVRQLTQEKTDAEQAAQQAAVEKNKLTDQITRLTQEKTDAATEAQNAVLEYLKGCIDTNGTKLKDTGATFVRKLKQKYPNFTW